ncbi:MAG: DUF805 domain-containing protein [Hyphomonadaceae bacterium]|nr:DUF805 domain-containing protein [Hyphomonadaceae bacterium]
MHADPQTKSQWVREEARMGRDKSKLIPVMIDGSPAPFGFGEVQAANLATWTGDPEDADWKRFSRAVSNAVGGAGAPAPPAVAPVAAPAPAYAPPRVQPQPVAVAAGAVETLSPVEYIQKCLRLFADGKGRARRAEYWWWFLLTVVVSAVALLLDAGLTGINPYTSMPNATYIYGASSLALMAPSISVLSRRFHDVGLNGWLVAAFVGVYVLGSLLAAQLNPIGGLLTMASGLGVLVIALIPSRPGPNQYGPNPKGA